MLPVIPGNFTNSGGEHPDVTVRITIPGVETYGDQVRWVSLTGGHGSLLMYVLDVFTFYSCSFSELFIFVVRGSGDLSQAALHDLPTYTYEQSKNRYVAARYTIRTPFEFTIGDRRTRGSGNKLFYNAPLERGNSYRVFVRYHSTLDTNEVRQL